MADLITLTGNVVDHLATALDTIPLDGVVVTASPSREVTQTSDGSDAMTDAATTSDASGDFTLPLVHAAGLRYTITYRVGGRKVVRGSLDCDSWAAGSVVDVSSLPPMAGVQRSAVETLQAWLLEQLAGIGTGEIDPAELAAAVEAYLTANPPAGGGSTTVQVGTLTLPASPAEGQSVSVLADSTTVLPSGVTWDSGGEPTVTDRLLISFVWSGEDWVGTYGLPIPAAPDNSDVTAPEWTATFTLGTPDETQITVTASALATDDIGVTGYQVSYDDGATDAPIGVSGFDFTLTGTASTTYATTKLRAVDGAGNVSAWLDVPSYTMATPADTTAPTWTATFTLGTPTSGSVTVTPSALATDNVAVTSYEATLDDTAGTVVWTNIGMPIGGVLTITGLTTSTTYADVALRAKDAAGNASAPLSVPSFTTASPAAPPDLGWLASYYADDLVLTDGADVATWADRTATYDLAGPSGRRPAYVASDPDFGGAPSVDFDIAGVPYLRTIADGSGAAWTSNAQPNTFVVVATFPYVSGEQSFIFSGALNNARHNLYRHPTTGLLLVRAGSTTATSSTTAPADGLAHLIGAIVNGSSTSLILDDTLVSLTGNVGTENSTGLTLGANDTGTPSTAYPYRGRIAFAGVIDGIATEGQLDDLWAWAQARYGL